MSKLLRWQRGRQESGYDKMLLATARIVVPFDCYLLRFPAGSEVPPHVDEVKNGRHYRLNIILRPARRGGEFHCAEQLFDGRRVKLFRPDLVEHSVSKVEEGTRYVLSIGWVRS